MAKKAATKAVAKKRKGATAKPRTTTTDDEGGGPILGTVQIGMQTTISVPGDATNYNEQVIEWGCLGLSEEPDSIRDSSGNAHLIDAKRPMFIDDEGLHVFFDPPLAGGGSYGFNFQFVYNEAVEVRSTPPKSDEELAKEREEREAATAEA